MRKLGKRTLSRLEVHERTKSGSVKTWIDPKTKRVFTHWHVSTMRNGSITPSQLTKVRKDKRKAAGLAKLRAMEEETGIMLDLNAAGDAWARSHGGSINDSFNDRSFWTDGIDLVVRWFYGDVTTYHFMLTGLFEIDDPRLLEYEDGSPEMIPTR